MNQVSPLIKGFLQRVQQEVIPKIVNATLPFYAVQNDQIVRDRSGAQHGKTGAASPSSSRMR